MNSVDETQASGIEHMLSDMFTLDAKRSDAGLCAVTSSLHAGFML